MNKQRRQAIEALKEQIIDLQRRAEALAQSVSELAEDEQDYLDNMPESLQSGQKGMAAEEAVSQLEDAANSLEAMDFDEIIAALEAAAL